MSDHYTEISEVFIGDPVDFRRDFFQLWLRGCSVQEAVTKIKTNSLKIDDPMESTEELVKKDVEDSYRIFDFFKESLFVNSWSIVDFTAEEKRFMCEEYFKLDENVIRDLLGMGIGGRKRSIITTNRGPTRRARELMEGLKVMLEFINSLDGSVSLVYALRKRFNISESLSKSYLCLIFLLRDNKEGETIRSKQFNEWTLIYNTVWFILTHWTVGTESLIHATDIEKGDRSPVLAYPFSLNLSTQFEQSCRGICEAVNKVSEKKNWQMKSMDPQSVDNIAKRVSNVLHAFTEKKSKVRQACELLSKLGQFYHNKNYSLDGVKESLDQCKDYINGIAPAYSYTINTVIMLCSQYIDTFYNQHFSYLVCYTLFKHKKNRCVSQHKKLNLTRQYFVNRSLYKQSHSPLHILTDSLTHPLKPHLHLLNAT